MDKIGISYVLAFKELIIWVSRQDFNTKMSLPKRDTWKVYNLSVTVAINTSYRISEKNKNTGSKDDWEDINHRL